MEKFPSPGRWRCWAIRPWKYEMPWGAAFTVSWTVGRTLTQSGTICPVIEARIRLSIVTCDHSKIASIWVSGTVFFFRLARFGVVL